MWKCLCDEGLGHSARSVTMTEDMLAEGKGNAEEEEADSLVRRDHMASYGHEGCSCHQHFLLPVTNMCIHASLINEGF